MLSQYRETKTHFNSRPHEEVDNITDLFNSDRKYFNSRPHEEVDQVKLSNLSYHQHFNSRPHEEVDFRATKNARLIQISTHDLTRRSTYRKIRLIA